MTTLSTPEAVVASESAEAFRAHVETTPTPRTPQLLIGLAVFAMVMVSIGVMAGWAAAGVATGIGAFLVVVVSATQVGRTLDRFARH